MAGFVYGNGTAFGLGSDFGFLFQPTHNTVYGVQKVLLSDKLLPWRAAIKAASLHTLAMSAPRIRESGVPEGLHPHYCLS